MSHVSFARSSTPHQSTHRSPSPSGRPAHPPRFSLFPLPPRPFSAGLSVFLPLFSSGPSVLGASQSESVGSFLLYAGQRNTRISLGGRLFLDDGRISSELSFVLQLCKGQYKCQLGILIIHINVRTTHKYLTTTRCLWEKNDRFYAMQNNLDHHYSSSDDGSQRINSVNPKVSESQYCTLESSLGNGAYPAQSSTSSHSISPISGSPLSQNDSHSDHTYNSPPSASCLTEVTDLQVKLKELENAILGPELDIASDSPEGFSHTNIPLRPDNWKQLLGIDTRDLKQVIVACGKAVAENDMFVTELLVSELGQLVSVSGDPMQRLGAYMLEGVVARLSSSGSMLYKSLKCKEPTSSELMSYMHLLYEICPFYKFGYMSANGAIAEAIKGENFVHIIDFQIAQGSQWVTLMQALAARPGGPPCLRITGIDDSNSAYARGGGLDIVGIRLHNVAHSCGLPFEFNAIPAASHEVELEHLDIRTGEVIAVNFAYQLHHVPDESVSVENHRDRIIRMIKSINPRVVTLVEQESNTNTAPFFPRYMETLNYYTAMFESIDVALPRDDKRRMSTEQHCVARDIVNIIACEGAERVERHELFGKWKARFSMAGFRTYPLNSVVNNTINTLLRNYNSCYRLEERDGVLYLGWKNRVLVVSSAWC